LTYIVHNAILKENRLFAFKIGDVQMPQIQKEAVRNEIIDKALLLFAKKGYDEISIADIAKAAGISVGNVYRYFKGKEDILNEIITSSFISKFRKEIFTKLGTGKSDTISEQSQNKEYVDYSVQFLKSMIENKFKFIVLIKCTKSEVSNLFRKEIFEYMVQTFLNQFVKEEEKKEALRPTIALLYKGLIGLYLDILNKDADEETYLRELKQVTKYHIFGLASIVEND
jgi:AcrR family transcriptional regulator